MRDLEVRFFKNQCVHWMNTSIDAHGHISDATWGHLVFGVFQRGFIRPFNWRYWFCLNFYIFLTCCLPLSVLRCAAVLIGADVFIQAGLLQPPSLTPPFDTLFLPRPTPSATSWQSVASNALKPWCYLTRLPRVHHTFTSQEVGGILNGENGLVVLTGAE